MTSEDIKHQFIIIIVQSYKAVQLQIVQSYKTVQLQIVQSYKAM